MVTWHCGVSGRAWWTCLEGHGCSVHVLSWDSKHHLLVLSDDSWGNVVAFVVFLEWRSWNLANRHYGGSCGWTWRFLFLTFFVDRAHGKWWMPNCTNTWSSAPCSRNTPCEHPKYLSILSNMISLPLLHAWARKCVLVLKKNARVKLNTFLKDLKLQFRGQGSALPCVSGTLLPCITLSHSMNKHHLKFSSPCCG